MTIVSFLSVALGGALGASLRYAMLVGLARDGFPVAVLGANVLGSFCMGFVLVALARMDLGGWQPFLMTGLLGGFTTFSAFALEAFILWERGHGAQAAAYVGLSVAGSLAALAFGVWMARGAYA